MKKTIISLFALAACTNETLDGGSTAQPQSIQDVPLGGTIAAQSFEPKAIDISFNQRTGKWILSIDNYENDCGRSVNPPPSDGRMTVSFVGFEPAAGTYVVAQPDRYATLQLGVYEANEGKEPDARSAKSGTLVLESFDETPGATVTGKLKVVADAESAVEGTFTAKVCPAR